MIIHYRKHKTFKPLVIMTRGFFVDVSVIRTNCGNAGHNTPQSVAVMNLIDNIVIRY